MVHILKILQKIYDEIKEETIEKIKKAWKERQRNKKMFAEIDACRKHFAKDSTLPEQFDSYGIAEWLKRGVKDNSSLVMKYLHSTKPVESKLYFGEIIGQVEIKARDQSAVSKIAARKLAEEIIGIIRNHLLESASEEDRLILSTIISALGTNTPDAGTNTVTRNTLSQDEKSVSGCITDFPTGVTEDEIICREEEVKAVTDMLRVGKPVVIVSGFGGIGKTSLALLIYNKIKDSFGITAWIPYAGNFKESCLASVRFKDERKSDKNAWWNAFSSEIGNSAEKKLFVIDNADAENGQNPDGDSALLSLTNWENTCVLVTSRLEEIPPYKKYTVGFMDDEKCVELFYHYYGNDLSREHEETVRRLAVDCARNHTFTIELLAKGARREDSLEAYYESVKSAFPTKKVKTDYNKTVTTTKIEITKHLQNLFKLSGRTEGEIKVLQAFAVLPRNAYLTEKELAEWFGLDGEDADELAKSGWLSLRDGRYSLHPLVRDIIHIDEIPENTAEAFFAFAADYGNDFIDAKHDYIELRRRMELMLSAQKEIGVDEGKDYASDFYMRIARAYELLADFDNALSFYEKAKETAEKKYGKNHIETATTYNNIALVYYDKGDYPAALAFYEKALAIKEEKLGKDHVSTVKTYNNIANVYQDKGDLDTALSFYQKALVIVEDKLGKDHVDTAVTYNNIAGVYYAKGDLDTALSYHEKARAICEEKLGKDHISTATTYNNIALVYRTKGDLDTALAFYEKALAIYENKLGKDHVSTATTYNNIASVYEDKGDLDEALAFYQKALAIFEDQLGKDHVDTATTYNNIAGVYQDKGDLDTALFYFQKALVIREKKLGKDHVSTATTYNNIALVYQDKGDYPATLSYFLSAYKIALKKLGAEHPNSKIVYDNLKGCYLASGRDPSSFNAWLAEQLSKD